MRAWNVLVTVVLMLALALAAGCTSDPGTKCKEDSDCASSAYCNRTLKVCVERSDAGLMDGGVLDGGAPTGASCILDCADPACANQICRPASGECDVAERCTNGACPADGFKADNTPCVTSCNGHCQGGACAGTMSCDDHNPCTDDACNALEQCIHTERLGRACPDDGNPCTDDVCDELARCVHPASAEGASCNSDDRCTTDKKCNGNKQCVGTPLSCSDDCNTGSGCDPATGCVKRAKPDGTECTDDGNPCTKDACLGGACKHGYPVHAATDWMNWPVVPEARADKEFILIGGANGKAAVDKKTCLMWKRDVEQGAYSWPVANDTSKACTSVVEGYGNWRLPTVTELLSLVDYKKTSSPAINTTVFPSVPGNWFWTSTGWAGDLGLAWLIDFNDGYVEGRTVPVVNKVTGYVRCVR